MKKFPCGAGTAETSDKVFPKQRLKSSRNGDSSVPESGFQEVSKKGSNNNNKNNNKYSNNYFIFFISLLKKSNAEKRKHKFLFSAESALPRRPTNLLNLYRDTVPVKDKLCREWRPRHSEKRHHGASGTPHPTTFQFQSNIINFCLAA